MNDETVKLIVGEIRKNVDSERIIFNDNFGQIIINISESQNFNGHHHGLTESFSGSIINNQIIIHLANGTSQIL